MKTKDPRQVRSIKKLQTAYLSLLLKENETITIQRICQEAELTRPTFYKLYKDTIDLRIHLHNEILHELKKILTITNLKTIEELQPKELPENMVALFEHIAENQFAYEVLLVYKPDALFINQVKAILERFVEDGIRISKTTESNLRSEMSFVISYTTGAYLESIIWWIQHNYKYSPKEMAFHLLDISFYGPYSKQIYWNQ